MNHWSEENLSCCFCHVCGEDGKSGKYFVNRLENIAAHQFCLYFSAGLPQNGGDNEGFDGFLIHDVLKEVRRSSKLKCKFCNENGASLGCEVKSCRFVYHYKCGLSNDVQFIFKGRFNSYCKTHRSFHDMSYINSMATVDCPVCLEEITSTGCDILKMPCCKNKYAHKECLQKQALASGYFFKCPTCNNEKQFRNEMSLFGIYIPQRDAVWEENDAYQDLLHRYDKCDMKKCLCESGNQHSTADGDWKFIHCSHCGQSAVHAFCLGKIISSDCEYICSDCSIIVKIPEHSRLKLARNVKRKVQSKDDSSICHWNQLYNIKPCYVRITRLTDEFIHKCTQDTSWKSGLRENVFATHLVRDHRDSQIITVSSNDLTYSIKKNWEICPGNSLVSEGTVFKSVGNISNSHSNSNLKTERYPVKSKQESVSEKCEAQDIRVFRSTRMSNVANRILSWISPLSSTMNCDENKRITSYEVCSDFLLTDSYSKNKNELLCQDKMSVPSFCAIETQPKLSSTTTEKYTISVDLMSKWKSPVTKNDNTELTLSSDESWKNLTQLKPSFTSHDEKRKPQSVELLNRDFANRKENKYLRICDKQQLSEPETFDVLQGYFNTSSQQNSINPNDTVMLQSISNKSSIISRNNSIGSLTAKKRTGSKKQKILTHRNHTKCFYIPNEQRSLDSWVNKNSVALEDSIKML